MSGCHLNGKKIPNKWNSKHNNYQKLVGTHPKRPKQLLHLCFQYGLLVNYPLLALSEPVHWFFSNKEEIEYIILFWVGVFSTFFSSRFARSRSWQEIAQDTMKDCNHALGRLQISHPFWGNKKNLPSMAKHIKDKNHISLQQSQKGRKMGLDPFLSRLEKNS